MGWSTDLYDASFRGVTFEVTAVTDAYNKSLAIHQAPYADDAQIEDMGLDPRKISITAMHTGDDYLSWTNALEAALAQKGSGELIHPVYGIIEVQVQSWQVSHSSEDVDYCAISIEFIKAEAEFHALFIPVATVRQIDYAMILEQPARALENELKALERNDPNAFLNAVSKIRNGLQAAFKIVSSARNFVDDALSPQDWMYSIVDSISNLVTFDITDISAINKWRGLSKQIKRLSTIFDNNDHNHSSALRQAWRTTVVTSQIAAAQEMVKLTRDEMSKPSSSSEPTLTPPELALIRLSVRQNIQQAIINERAVTYEESEQYQLRPVMQIAIYKEVADQIHEQIQELIETRPPITTIVVNQPSTTHLLAHQLYGDFSRSSEILRLNPDLENPALLRTGQELTVYAR